MAIVPQGRNNFNVYQPDVGNIMAKGLQMKAASQNIEANKLALDEHDEKKQAAIAAARFEKVNKALSQMIEVDDPKKSQAIWDAYGFEQEAPKVSGDGKDVSIERADGTVVKGPKNKLQSFLEWTAQDPSLWKRPDILNAAAVQAGLSIERQEPAGRTSDRQAKMDTEKRRSRVTTLTKDLDTLKKGKVDDQTFAKLDPVVQQILSQQGSGPGQQPDPEARQRAINQIEFEIRKLKAEINDDDPTDPFGIKPKGIVGRGQKNIPAPEMPPLYDYSNMMAK